jgi:Fe-S-cluster containining protein
MHWQIRAALRRCAAMSRNVTVRPVWRSFRHRYLARAALHVKNGGHAVVVRDDGAIDLLLTVDASGKITELGLWAVLAIEQQRWRRVKDGPAVGLATARVRTEFEGSVLDWCERDAAYPKATRRMKLDCLECAACCHDANVLLDEADFARWHNAGRKDLLGKSYLKRANGKVTLRFLPSGKCQHLRRDRKCGIYPIRPDNCRSFVVGSEACLAAREDTLDIRDGLPPAEVAAAED